MADRRQLERQIGYLTHEARDVAWNGDGLRAASLFIQAAQVAIQMNERPLANDLADNARRVLSTFMHRGT